MRKSPGGEEPRPKPPQSVVFEKITGKGVDDEG